LICDGAGRCWPGFSLSDAGSYTAIVLSVVAALLVCLTAHRIGQALGVMDMPDGKRKLHRGPMPLTGGLALLAGAFAAIVGSLLLAPAASFSPTPTWLISVTLFIATAVLGFLDDRHVLPASRKLGLTAIWLSLLVGLHAGHIPPAFTLSGFEVEISSLAMGVLSVVGALFVIHAISIIDGIDGLCASSGLVWITTLLCLPGTGSDPFLLGLVAALAVVLIFNLAGRLFLGESGASLIAAVVAIYGLQALGSGAITHGQAIAFMFIPAFDAFLLILLRLLRGQTIFAAGRDHLHHFLADGWGLATWQVSAIYTAATAAACAGALHFPELDAEIIAVSAAICVLVRVTAPRPLSASGAK